jgi:hypothetical protein
MMPPNMDFSTMTDEERQALRAQRTSQSKQTVLVQIAYTDTMGNRNVIDKEVPLNPSAMMAASVDGTTTTAANGFRGMRARQESFWSKYQWYFIGLAVLVVGFIAYRRYKRKRLENPKFKLSSLFKRKKK